MSFSSLPPELVHQIIKTTVPHTFHSSTYRKRQETLCRLSLVSRQCRSIARPLLLEIAWPSTKHEDHFRRLLGEDSELVFRELVFEGGGGLFSSFVGRTIGSSPNLRSLTIQIIDGNVIDLSVLSSCKNLVNLQLSGYDFDVTSLDVLPSLQALSLNYQAVDVAYPLLDPQKVPALKGLGLKNVDLPSELEHLGNTRLGELLPQLEALCIEPKFYTLAKGTLLSNLAPRMLITVRLNQISDLSDSDLSTIQYLRIRTYVSASDRLDAIRPLAQFLESGQQSKPRQLRSIYLDPDVRPGPSDAEEVHEELQSWRRYVERQVLTSSSRCKVKITTGIRIFLRSSVAGRQSIEREYSSWMRR